MPEKTFMPYAYAEEGLEISPAAAMLDGTAVPADEIIDRANGYVSLAADSWTEFRLEFEAQDVNDQLQDLLLHGEDTDAVAIYSVVRDSETRQREAAKLVRTDARTWQGSVRFLRSQRYGSASWQLFAVRESDGRNDGQHAFRAGERVADSATWRAYFDDRPSVPGGAMETEWRDFENDTREELRRSKDCVWYLDLGDTRRPRLFVNEGVKGLKRALENNQRTGRAARVRDSLAQSILQPVLTQMSVSVLKDLEDTGFDEIEAWKQQFLTAMASHHQTQTEELTIEGWQQAWRDDERARVLAEIGNSIQRHVRLSNNCEQLIKALEERGNG